MKDLAGKVVLITGAASGIGRGMVEVFGRAGMTVVAADVNAEGLAATADAMKSFGIKGFTSILDVRDRAGWEILLDRTWAELGPVQLLCNNAGVTATPKPFLETPPEAWDWVTEINMGGSFNGSQAVARRLVAQGLGGHIVNTASVQGLYAAPNFAPYNASKFAVVGFTETLAIEMKPYGIGVSILCPGPTKGDILRNSAKIAPELATAPQGRAREGFDWAFKMPVEVAQMVLDAVIADRFYIFTHAEYGPVLKARAEALLATQWQGEADRVAKMCEIEAAPIAAYEAMTAAAKASSV